jgi:hypothetical protein
LSKIQNDGINLEELRNNEEFIDVLLQAIPMGLKHHQEEKRYALKNAIINSAHDDAPDISLQQTFLSCIDTFTVWHINVLMLFTDPKKWFEKNGKGLPGMENVGSVRGTLTNAFPILNGKDDFVGYIWNDLYNKGFVTSDKSLLQTMMSSRGSIEKRTSKLGDQFIKFIS